MLETLIPVAVVVCEHVGQGFSPADVRRAAM
jgi:hypothetical protein